MSYQLLTEGGHVCTLPDPATFKSGAEIACVDVILLGGTNRRCGKRYWRSSTFWRLTPVWSGDFAW